jgi:hypothetical protein
MKKIVFVVTACLVLSISSMTQSDEPKPSVSNEALTADEVAIYRAAIEDFVPVRGRSTQVANITVPLAHWRIVSCVEGITTPSTQGRNPVVHRLGPAVVAGKELPLVDPWEVPQVRHGPPDPNIPRLGLLTLSEIAFGEKHLSATVIYDFVCGGLCGHGKVLSLSKAGEEWKINKICSRWMY